MLIKLLYNNVLEWPQMTVEFGIPQDWHQACIRIPDRTNPNYGIHGSPYEHCTHVRDFVENFAAVGGGSKWFLEDRMAPLNVEDLRLLFSSNSFKRDLSENVTTVDWAHLEDGDDIWSKVLPVGDDNYRWWQITAFLPNTVIGDCKLYCIEMNSKHSLEKSSIRFNTESEFEIVFATKDEIELLKHKLSGPC